jgi:hypothetical protein
MISQGHTRNHIIAAASAAEVTLQHPWLFCYLMTRLARKIQLCIEPQHLLIDLELQTHVCKVVTSKVLQRVSQLGSRRRILQQT